jgi:hypothetical protein
VTIKSASWVGQQAVDLVFEDAAGILHKRLVYRDDEHTIDVATYVASAKLDTTRIGRDAGRINEEIIQHLATLPGADVSVTLEVHVTVPDGIDERAMRVVSENATALKLRVSNFERE